MIRSTVSDSVNADSQSANVSQNYDGNGNPTDNLLYDINDRLTNVSLGGGSNVAATYRSDGLRATKQINVNGNTGSPTYFLYDGTRVLCELDASGNVTAAYGYGGTGLAQRYSATTASYTAYTFDPMGNVVGRMRQQDAPSVPFDMSAYDAFGQRRVYVSGAGLQNNSVPPDSVGYGGQLGNVTDVETNLVLMGFRYYSPFYCRFLTRDPSGYGGGINLYAYCRNNPINRADPLGLDDTGGPEDEVPLSNAQGVLKEPFKQINTGAKKALIGLKVVNSFSPATQVFEAATGKRAAEVNQKVPTWERALTGALFAAVPLGFLRHGIDLEVDFAAWLGRGGAGRKAATVITADSKLIVRNAAGDFKGYYDGQIGKLAYEVKSKLSTNPVTMGKDAIQFLNQLNYAKSTGRAYRVFHKGPITAYWKKFGEDNGIIFVQIPGLPPI